MTGIVVSLFDKTGNMVRPWAEAGYECHCYDIQTQWLFARREPHFYHADLMHEMPSVSPYTLAVFAFPPCTHLAVSGARWFKGKGLRALADSVHMFATAAEYAEACGAPYLIENPVSTISTYWRKPDHNFHPWHYTGFEPADNYTKQTCLWVGGGFVMPERNSLDGLPKPDNRIHAAPSVRRARRLPQRYADGICSGSVRSE